MPKRNHDDSEWTMQERETRARAYMAKFEPAIKGMAELVEMAAHLRLTPGHTLRLALRALAAELAKAKPARVGRLVGKERGLLEGRR